MLQPAIVFFATSRSVYLSSVEEQKISTIDLSVKFSIIRTRTQDEWRLNAEDKGTVVVR